MSCEPETYSNLLFDLIKSWLSLQAQQCNFGFQKAGKKSCTLVMLVDNCPSTAVLVGWGG